MTEIRLIGSSIQPARGLYSARLTDLGKPEFFVDQLIKPFVAFTALDARRYSDEQLRAFAKAVLDQGCVYVCAWGPESGRVETAFDEVAADAELAGEPYASIVMTTSHDESLDAALRYSVFAALPPDAEARAVVALSEDRWADEIEPRFADSERLNADVLSADEEDRS
jgi:hypothetical protein